MLKPKTLIATLTAKIKSLITIYYKYIGIIFILSTLLLIFYNKYISDYDPSNSIQLELLLLPTIVSVTISIGLLTLLVKEEAKEIKKQEDRGPLLFFGIMVVSIFTFSIIFLCFDIYPLPSLTTRWVIYWAASFIIGWIMQIIFLLCIIFKIMRS